MELTMSEKELDRLSILSGVNSGFITQVKAGELLELSSRQIRRLLLKMEFEGPSGLISKKRGKTSNRMLSTEFRERVLKLIDRDYYDYGPTLISEKLLEHAGIKVGKETIRRWLIESNRRQVKGLKPIKVRQLRARRDCFGELVQMDGSTHDWFEGRGEKCTLLVFIDDATSRLVNLRFVPAETTHGYFSALHEYIIKYGKPRAVYTDKHTVFKVNTPGGNNTTGLTQFGRALKELNIKAIFAHSPEAKGRVERANNTLQDRLIKELRYHKISTIEQANKFLQKQYINEYNRKFSVMPKNDIDLHQPLTKRERFKLDNTLSIQTVRQINKNLIIHHNNISYNLINVGKGYRYQKQKVTICEKPDGTVDIIHRGRKLEYVVHSSAQYKPTFANRKDIDAAINKMHFLLHYKISNRDKQDNQDIDYA